MIQASVGIEHMFEKRVRGARYGSNVNTTGGIHMTTPRADVVTLGEARFGHLEGGPFDGRCYPLLDGTPPVLDVPVDTGIGGADRTIRYVLRRGRYRYAGAERPASAA